VDLQKTVRRAAKASLSASSGAVVGVFALWVSVIWGGATWDNISEGRFGWAVVSAICAIAAPAVAAVTWVRQPNTRTWPSRLGITTLVCWLVTLFMAMVAVLTTLP
jgi:hypothetical protein